MFTLNRHFRRTHKAHIRTCRARVLFASLEFAILKVYAHVLNKTLQYHWREKRAEHMQAQHAKVQHDVKLKSMCKSALEKWQMPGPLMLQILTRLEAFALKSKYHDLQTINKDLIAKAESCRAATTEVVTDMRVLDQLKKAVLCQTEMCQRRQIHRVSLT
jgi:hypothetical protein